MLNAAGRAVRGVRRIRRRRWTGPLSSRQAAAVSRGGPAVAPESSFAGRDQVKLRDELE